MVDASASPTEARSIMEANRVDWIGVRDEGVLLGWVGEADLNGDPTVATAPRRPFRTAFGPGTTLKAALDGIVTSQTRVAVVVEDDNRYLGMLTIDDLAEGLG